MKNKKTYQLIENNFSISRIIKNIISMVLFPLKYILPKKYIIFSGTTNYNYNGNSRYLFEYLSKNSTYDVYWFTRSKKIQEYLEKNDFHCLTYANPFKLIIYSAMAKIIFNDGDSYFNLFGLSDTKMTCKICLFHGYGPKTTLVVSENLETKNFRLRRINKFNFVNFTSNYLANEISHEIFNLPRKKAVLLGFPKTDNFFDKNLSDNSRYKKEMLTSFFGDKVNQDSKVILYTPTWRPYNYDLPLMTVKGFNEKLFNDYLEKNNMFLVYTTHSVQRPSSFLKNTKHIKYIDESFHLYDTNEMMLETDILLNDYSTTSVEFSILKRPQIFCMPDYDEYNTTKGFIDDYKKTMPGDSFDDIRDFFSLLDKIIDNESQYIENYKKEREYLLDKYYNLSNTKSVENYNIFLKTIMGVNKNYEE